jgi:hypothetical protein
MQFSYGISEADYVKAWKLRRKSVSRPTIVRTLMFWVFILVCLIVLWVVVVQKNVHTLPTPTSAQDAADGSESCPAPPPAKPANTTLSMIENVGPFVALGGIWFFVMFRLSPVQLRKLYRKDPQMQGRFTVEITPDFIGVENTAGFSSRSGWGLYETWEEGNDLITLGMRSTAYLMVGISELSPGQRDDLRAILSSALPKK